METSEHINELATALAAAQGKLPSALKTAINDAFKRNGKGSAYATLDDCVKAAHPVLSEHGLCIIQGINGGEFIARLAHKSGQWTQLRVPLPSGINTIQQLVACNTYMRRMTYSLVGLSSDDDDDGNEAAKAGDYVAPLDTLKSRNWKDNPKGDIDPRVDSLAWKYAEAFIRAKTPDAAHTVETDMNDERDENDEKWGDILKMSVWAKIDSTNRARIKKLLAAQAAA
jgi:hypothetical protein